MYVCVCNDHRYNNKNVRCSMLFTIINVYFSKIENKKPTTLFGSGCVVLFKILMHDTAECTYFVKGYVWFISSISHPVFHYFGHYFQNPKNFSLCSCFEYNIRET